MDVIGLCDLVSLRSHKSLPVSYSINLYLAFSYVYTQRIFTCLSIQVLCPLLSQLDNRQHDNAIVDDSFRLVQKCMCSNVCNDVFM